MRPATLPSTPGHRFIPFLFRSYLTFIDSAPLPLPPRASPGPSSSIPHRPPDHPTSSLQTSFVFPFLPSVLSRYRTLSDNRGGGWGVIRGCCTRVVKRLLVSSFRSIFFADTRDSIRRSIVIGFSEKRFTGYDFYGFYSTDVASAFRSSCFPTFHWDDLKRWKIAIDEKKIRL